VQGSLNATTLFIYSVSYFNLEGLSPPWPRYCGAHGVLAFLGPKKTFKDDVLSSNFARWSVT